MNCINCGKMIEQDSKFCIYCGAPVSSSDKKENICPSCGARLDPGYKFCIYCGKKLIQPVIYPGKDTEQKGRICTSCGAPIAPGLKFCAACGARAAEDETPGTAPEIIAEPAPLICSKCGAKITPGYKFCISCGTPVASKEDTPSDGPDKSDGSDPPEDEAGIPEDNPEGTHRENIPETGSAQETGETHVQEEKPVPPESDKERDTLSENPRKQILVLTNLDSPGISYTRPIRDEISIGRSWSDIVIKDDLEVSRMHCRVLIKDGKLYLNDQGSKNGTIYRNSRIPSWQDTPFTSGDMIRIGKYTYSLELKNETEE